MPAKRPVVVALIAMLALAGASTAAAETRLTGEVPSHESPGGIALVQWTGGTLDELEESAITRGCQAASVWVTTGGSFTGYVFGAPEFANTSWFAAVGTDLGSLAMLIVCRTPGLDSCPVSSPVFDRPAGAQGSGSPREALDLGLQALGELPVGTFARVAADDALVVWELIAPDGVTVGRFEVIRDAGGWHMNRAESCTFSA